VRPRVAIPLALVIAGGMWVWRAELFNVARPGDAPLPLSLRTPAARPKVDVDVALPAVPAGMLRLRGGENVVLIHYWAPWERHSRDQAQALDSLRREPDLGRLHVALVCSDPFPSVARYVARYRLRLAVLLDGKHELRRALPCPSIPYTYVLDRSGRIAVEQAGEVDWWSESTRRTLREILEEAQEAPLTRAAAWPRAGPA
jgi:hypothetical protein